MSRAALDEVREMVPREPLTAREVPALALARVALVGCEVLLDLLSEVRGLRRDIKAAASAGETKGKTKPKTTRKTRARKG